MANPISRTMTYRRAVWTDSSTTLQGFVNNVHKRLPKWKDRVFDYKGSEISGLAHAERNGATLVHVAQCDRGRSTSLVPQPDGREAVDTAELRPPDKNDFLKGDITFLVKDDHVLLCPSGVREAVVSHYLEAAAGKIGDPSWASRCALEPVADLSTLRLIEQEGVKEIRLDATLYEATLAYEEAKAEATGVRRTFAGHIAGAFMDLFREDKDLSDIEDDENISVKLEIHYDKRRKGGAVGRERMKSLSDRLIEGHEHEFRIVTGEGKVITPDELKIKQRHFFESFGITVAREDAWVALADFFEELERSGALES